MNLAGGIEGERAAGLAAKVPCGGAMPAIQHEIAIEAYTPVRAVSTAVDRAESANLDLLRSIAVLCVLFSHVLLDVFGREKLGPLGLEAMGRIGVIFFFIHTSLVLLMSLKRSSASLVQFYVRRAFRIYPLSILTIAVVLIAKIPYAPDAAYMWPGWTAVANNLLLFTALPHGTFVIGPLWSLPYEANMYLVLPFVYMAVRQGGRECAWLLYGTSVTAVLLAAVMRLSVVTDLLLFAPCFLSGAIAFVTRSRRLPGRHFALLLIATIFVFCAVSLNNALSWALDWTAAAFVGYSIPAFSEITCPTAAAISKHIARYSYGIYLSHAPIMRICFSMSKWSTGAQWATFAVMMMAVPPILYHFIEAPCIRLGKRLSVAQGMRFV